MANRAPFLRTRFGGYYHHDVPDEDAEVTHVGPGTSGGQYLRRFWQPVCFSDDLRDLSVGDGCAKEHLIQVLLLRRVDHLGDLPAA
jgi:hypothetical protein